MRQQTITTIATYAVLLLAGAAPFTMPDQLGSEASALGGGSDAGSLVSTTAQESVPGARIMRSDVASADSRSAGRDLLSVN